MVDYSKWDDIPTSSSDDSDDEEPKPPKKTKNEASKENPEDLKLRGNEAYRNRDFDEAIRWYTEAIGSDGQNHVYFSNRAACYANKKPPDWEACKRDAMAVLRLNKTFVKGYVHLSKAYLNLGQISQCQQCIKIALRQCKGEGTTALKKILQQAQGAETHQKPEKQEKTRPGSRPRADASCEEKAAWLKGKGNEHYKEKEYSAALSYYTQAIEQAPHMPIFYGNRAACLLMLNRYTEAAQDCDRGLKIDPLSAKLILRKSTALLHEGDIEGAEQCLEDGLQSGVSASDESMIQQQQDIVRETKRHWARGDAALEQGKWSVARACFSKVENAGVSASQKLQLGVAKCCAEMQEWAKCGQLTQAVISKDRGCIPAYLLRAESLYYMGSQDQAMKHLQAALRMDPDHTASAKRYKELKRTISEKSRLSTDIKEAMRGRKFEEALTMCDEMLALDAKDKSVSAKMNVKKAEAYSKMAVVLARKKDTEKEAEKIWKACLKCACTAIYHDESLIPAYLHKVKAMQSLQQFQEALEEIEALAKGIGRGNESVHEHLKHARFELKKSKRKDYYKLLNCRSGSMASEKDIKVGYRKAAMKWHPDRWSSGTDEEKAEAERMFKEVGEANDVLSNSQMKRLYDQGYDLEEIKQRMEMQNQRHRHGGFGGFRGGGFPF